MGYIVCNIKHCSYHLCTVPCCTVECVCVLYTCIFIQDLSVSGISEGTALAVTAHNHQTVSWFLITSFCIDVTEFFFFCIILILWLCMWPSINILAELNWCGLPDHLPDHFPRQIGIFKPYSHPNSDYIHQPPTTSSYCNVCECSNHNLFVSYWFCLQG